MSHHPRYSHPSVPGEPAFRAHIGDEVAHLANPRDSIGVITAIYLESVETSTGDQWLAGQLVLLRRALDGAA